MKRATFPKSDLTLVSKLRSVDALSFNVIVINWFCCFHESSHLKPDNGYSCKIHVTLLYCTAKFQQNIRNAHFVKYKDPGGDLLFTINHCAEQVRGC
jgi:hypothetical protein